MDSIHQALRVGGMVAERVDMRAVGRGVRYREQTRLDRFSAPQLKCSVGLASAGGRVSEVESCSVEVYIG